MKGTDDEWAKVRWVGEGFTMDKRSRADEWTKRFRDVIHHGPRIPGLPPPAGCTPHFLRQAEKQGLRADEPVVGEVHHPE